MGEAEAIVRRAFQAYADDDRAAIEAVIGEPFSFTSPLDNSLDRARYFERCWPDHTQIRSFRLERVIAEGETVVVTCEGEWDHGAGFRNTEIHTVRAGQIVSVEVYFGWSLPHPAPAGGFLDS